jgi:hypothetical protein
LITEVKAQQIAEKFLLSKYFNSKTNFSGCQLIATNDSQVYQLRGELTMYSRSTFDHFVIPKSANKFKFKIEIDAQQGQIISYELN